MPDFVIPLLLAVLICVAIWLLVEVALLVKKARGTVDKVDDVVAKADPLIEHATLTIDAVNLEIMRVDGILEDVSKVTDGASQAADAISNVKDLPSQIVTSVASKVRGTKRSQARTRKLEQLISERAALSGSGTLGLEGQQSAQASDADAPEGMSQLKGQDPAPAADPQALSASGADTADHATLNSADAACAHDVAEDVACEQALSGEQAQGQDKEAVAS